MCQQTLASKVNKMEGKKHSIFSLIKSERYIYIVIVVALLFIKILYFASFIYLRLLTVRIRSIAFLFFGSWISTINWNTEYSRRITFALTKNSSSSCVFITHVKPMFHLYIFWKHFNPLQSSVAFLYTLKTENL